MICICARSEECRHDLGMALVAGGDERRPPIVIAMVQVSTVSEQQLHDRQVASAAVSRFTL